MSERHVKVSERQFGIFSGRMFACHVKTVKMSGKHVKMIERHLGIFSGNMSEGHVKMSGRHVKMYERHFGFLKVQYIGQLSQRVCQKIKFSFTVSPNLKNLSNTISHTVHINMSLQKPLPLEMP